MSSATYAKAKPPTTVVEEEFRHLGLTLLAIPYKGNRGIGAQVCRYRAHYGTGWVVAAHLWAQLQDAIVATDARKMEKRHLLWCLYFFRRYDTEEACASRFQTTEKTFRERCKECIELIALLEPHYVSLTEKN